MLFSGMKPFHLSILPDPLSLSFLTSVPLRQEMVKSRAKISLSSRGSKGYTLYLSKLGNFRKGRDSTLRLCLICVPSSLAYLDFWEKKSLRFSYWTYALLTRESEDQLLLHVLVSFSPGILLCHLLPEYAECASFLSVYSFCYLDGIPLVGVTDWTVFHPNSGCGSNHSVTIFGDRVFMFYFLIFNFIFNWWRNCFSILSWFLWYNNVNLL